MLYIRFPEVRTLHQITAHLVVSIFPDFGLPGKREFSRNSQAFPGISREIYAPYDSSFSSIHLYHNLYTNTFLKSLGDDKAKVTQYMH